MKRLLKKYEAKLVDAGLAEPGAPVLGGLDDEPEFNRTAAETPVLAEIFHAMQANSLLCFEPAPLHRAIIGYLARRSDGTITPQDCETRTFLHDLPVVHGFSTKSVIRAFARRKCAVVLEADTVRVVAYGTVSPEQAFVTASSVCFACFVLFFSDYLRQCTFNRSGKMASVEEQGTEAVPAPAPASAPEKTAAAKDICAPMKAGSSHEQSQPQAHAAWPAAGTPHQSAAAKGHAPADANASTAVPSGPSFSGSAREGAAENAGHAVHGISGPDEEFSAVFRQVVSLLPAPLQDVPPLMRGPFEDADEAKKAMGEVGRLTVNMGLVDSFFGNVSCRVQDTVLISQTGSSLDELEGNIDACPRDGSSCAGLTASSELTAHARIYEDTDAHVILHGHPRFAVIMSMLCHEDNCPDAGACHIRCSRGRFAGGVPVVPGEVGTGPYGLCNTLPPAMRGKSGAIVHGHGLFTASSTDFNEAFASLLRIEHRCRSEYFKLVATCTADGPQSRATAAPSEKSSSVQSKAQSKD